jgi:hypothetical protein
METAHFQDFRSANCEKIREVIQSGRTPVLQFSEPPDAATIKRTDDFCREFGAELQIRFFSFRWQEFDTSLLRHLPHVANLSIDTIRAISDFGPVSELPRLTRLRFGVHEHPDGNFLEQLDIARLTHLTLGENKRRNFDLSPLSVATSLEQLFIQGHYRGVEAISGLPRLFDVSLSGFPKRHDLAFLNDLAALRSLLLILGSRASIAEFTHSELRRLRIVWVRQLEELGPLQRFSSLKELTIEDQLRLTTLDISGLNLRRLTVSNCKGLKEIVGLERQTGLEHFHTRDTKLPNDQRGAAIGPRRR